MSETSITYQEAERFLVEEAALLDEWRLNDWFKLIAEGGRYLVPALDTPNADHRDTLFLVSDDYVTLKSRVAQLLGRSTWSENPRSRTRRLVTNVRVLECNGEEALVTANFAVWRFQLDSTDVYVGKYMHKLVRTPEGLRFNERRAVLDLETLRPHGKLSFIL
jgi:p-cumate 2,3-dioxygenase subunit beta